MNDSAEATTAAPGEPKGIGGWLVLPLIEAVGLPLFLSVMVAVRVVPPFAGYSPQLFFIALLLLTFVLVPLILFRFFCLARFLQRRRSVPSLMTIVYVINILVWSANLYLITKGYKSFDQSSPPPASITVFRNVACFATALNAIYIAYFWRAKRVKNTFVN